MERGTMERGTMGGSRRKRGDQVALAFAVLLTLAMFASQAFHLYRSVDSGVRFDRAAELSTIVAEGVIFFVAIGGWLFFMSRIRATRDQLREEEATRIRTQEKLIEAQKIEALGQMAAGVAHDFGNQLAVINGSLDLAFPSVDPGSSGAVHLSRARTAAEQASQTVQSLMLFGRRSAGRKVPVDLTEVADEATTLAAPMLRPGIELDVRGPDTPLWTEGDRTQLVQVLLNLTLNALDAMPDGGKITIETACVGEARPSICPLVQMSVTDTGIGMSAEIAERVFEPFFTTREGIGTTGTGLGLSVVHGIVTSMGGKVTVSSVPGVGSRFEVTVPTARGRTCRESVTPVNLAAAQDRVIVDLEDEYGSALVVEALQRAGINAALAGRKGAGMAADARIIIAQGGAVAEAVYRLTDSVDLVAVDPPREIDLPARVRSLTSPVSASRLITEVSAVIHSKASA